MLKKTALAIFGLAASSFASAGMYSPPPAPSCTPGDVTVPCEAQKWDIGIQALYLKPILSGRQGYEINSTLTNVTELNQDWGWGYRLEGSYHFNTGNDITMTWMHYDVDANHGPFTGILPIPATNPSARPITAYIDNRFDQINLVMGQHVDMGLLKNARFYGGLQYAKIRYEQRNNYTALPAFLALQGVGAVSHTTDTDFNGVGPVVGIDYAYDLPNGFSVTANTAGSILYGTNRYNSNLFLGPSGLVATSAYASKKAIVPSMEAKLGLNYAYELAQGMLNIEGGYQVVNYFSALETRAYFGTGPAGASDFGLYGPYLGVKWVANA